MGSVATTAMNWTSTVPLIVAILALVGVSLTAGLQYTNTRKQMISAHALKMAEMRQAWINNLRDAMAEFHSYAVTPDLKQDTTREFYEKGTKIELLMNVADEHFPELQNCMYAYLGASTMAEKYKANPRFIDVCQRILRKEWLVLKADLAKAHQIKPSDPDPPAGESAT